MLTKRKLKYLLALNIIWSVIGLFADWAWLSQIPLYLTPFTAICSLYPPLLAIWYGLKLYDRNPPNWLTLWIASGTLVYGILATIYFPLLMTWKGINFHDVGSIFWVAVYGFQTVIMAHYLKKPTISEVAFVLGFFFLADFSHYQLKTFVDFIIPGYPLWLKTTTVVLGIITQISVLLFYSIVKFMIPQESRETSPAQD